jgi:N-methylhydantoinase A
VVRIGVDVGGTFTDLVAVDDSGGLRVVKVPSTPPDFQLAVLDAIAAVLTSGGGGASGKVRAVRRPKRGRS